jgi:hypothetical protein
MGLLAILGAAVIIIITLVFLNFPGSPFNSKTTPLNSVNIQNSAQDAVDTTLEKSKLRQNQTELDYP